MNLVIACGDDENIRKIKFDKETIYYGFNDNNDIIAKNVVLNENGSKFDCYINDELYGTFEIPLFGKHMILNALSAIAVSRYYGISLDDTKKYINEFKGAKRRFKIKEFGNVVTVDDYAHHPTEIEVTLASARQKYPNKEVVGVFLPNTYSRTEALMDDFVRVLSKADKAYVMDIHCDRERQEDYPGVSSDTIMDRVPNCEKVSVEDCEKLLKHDNAVICFMSCTNIYEIEDAFEKLISNK